MDGRVPDCAEAMTDSLDKQARQHAVLPKERPAADTATPISINAPDKHDDPGLRRCCCESNSATGFRGFVNWAVVWLGNAPCQRTGRTFI